jgi:hypothetical protein
MVSGTFTEATSCILVGTLGEGAACNDSPDTCAAGLACIIPVSGPAACRRICRLGSSAGCKTGQSCQGPFPALLTSPVFGACT